MRTWFHAVPVDGFQLERHFSSLHSVNRRLERGGRGPVAVTVGASDLSMDMPDYLRALQDSTKWTFVFVEPLEWLLPALKERVMSHGAKEEQVHIVNAAMCNSSSSSVNLHTIPAAALDEHNLGHLKKELSHLSSLERRTLKKGIRESAIIPSHLKSVLERKVRAVQVPCITPAGLLERLEVSAEDLELLVIDAEGFDLAVLRPFMAMEGFAPSQVKFEWVNLEHRWTALMQTLQDLAAMGYNVRQEHFDLVAVNTRYF